MSFRLINSVSKESIDSHVITYFIFSINIHIDFVNLWGLGEVVISFILVFTGGPKGRDRVYETYQGREFKPPLHTYITI